MNIQTTADLISYVKEGRMQEILLKNKRQWNSRPNYVPMSSNTKVKRDLNNMRIFGLVQNNKSIEIQTEEIDILDLRA